MSKNIATKWRECNRTAIATIYLLVEDCENKLQVK